MALTLEQEKAKQQKLLEQKRKLDIQIKENARKLREAARKKDAHDKIVYAGDMINLFGRMLTSEEQKRLKDLLYNENVDSKQNTKFKLIDMVIIQKEHD